MDGLGASPSIEMQPPVGAPQGAANPASPSIHVRYVFADVVDFTVGRTANAQVEIISALSDAFKSAADPYGETIFLPTGDGICAGIVDQKAADNCHLATALAVLKHMHEWCQDQRSDRKCEVRVGINESRDVPIKDINDKPNLAGAGINMAQRLMNIADGNQIIVGNLAYETLRFRDENADASHFRKIKAQIKHEEEIEAYQFIGLDVEFLNRNIPSSAQPEDTIDSWLSAELRIPQNQSEANKTKLLEGALNQWDAEIEAKLAWTYRSTYDGSQTEQNAVKQWREFLSAVSQALDARGFERVERLELKLRLAKYLSAVLDNYLSRPE